VLATGADHHGGHGFERDALSIRLEKAFTLEDDVDLGHLFVVMDAAVRRDVREVDGGQCIPRLIEGASGLATGAGDGCDLIKLGDGETFVGHGSKEPPELKVSSLSGSLSFRLLLFKERLKIFTDPTEGCFKAALLVDDADLRLHGCWIALTAEELIAGESSFHFGIHFTHFSQHMTAHVEFEHSITDPGVLTELEDGVGVWSGSHGSAILRSNGGRSTWDVTETKNRPASGGESRAV
jgi:hypothetical protein